MAKRKERKNSEEERVWCVEWVAEISGQIEVTGPRTAKEAKDALTHSDVNNIDNYVEQGIDEAKRLDAWRIA